MKLFVLILASSFLLQLFLPWWMIAIVSFILSAWLATSSKIAFRAAFWAIFILWLAVCLYQTLPNQNILANRVAQLFMLPDTKFSWIAILLVSCLLGALVAGFSGLAGYYAGQLLPKQTASNKA
ncbi:hypothetical protein GS399_17595 [Pedobacter sp. HMF7647]|uniref:Transmembrane protein n=1 Tax=Hufsiella arboris TaxID=2695275 RepID=A0A7K1YEF5_9SPHI|nr:hypothetical protein [Hufsiella arboris]MXV52790.1 hypothetical protein [Hufsiella arboris]